jgi:DNA modification methylase
MNPYQRKEVIGDCTLYMGDCLEILPELAWEWWPASTRAGSYLAAQTWKADMVFTDPPYGHNNNNNDLIHNWEKALGKKVSEQAARPIANDGPEANDLFRLTMKLVANFLLPGCCCCCCCGGGGPDPQFARWSLWMDEHLNFKQMVIWDKGPMGMGWHYRRSYETVLVGEKSGAACAWFDTTNKIENIIRPGSGIAKIIPSSEQHPTEKPVALSAHFIKLHSIQGGTILDPFMGSGTTGVACVQLDRKFIGIEIEPKYFDIACQRIEEAYKQPKLFTEPPPKPEQEAMFT